MSNPFDTLGQYDDDLGGLFSKLKKGFRKFEKKVNKARRKFHRKILPKKVANRLVKLEKNKKIRNAAKIAGAAAAIYFTGGAAAGLLKAGAAKIGAFATSSAVKKVGAFAVKNALQKKAARLSAGNAADADTMNQLYYDSQNAANMVMSPEFNEVAGKLRSQGMSEDDIMRTWAQSNTFKQTAIPEIARTVYPQYRSTYTGLPDDIAREKALIDSEKAAKKAVDDVGGVDTKTILTIGAPILAALLMRG